MADLTPKEMMDAYELQRVKVGACIEKVENGRRSLRWSEEELERERQMLKKMHASLAPVLASETARLLGDEA